MRPLAAHAALIDAGGAAGAGARRRRSTPATTPCAPPAAPRWRWRSSTIATDELRFAGIGNISACIIDGDARKQMVSHNGIVGHNMRKVQEFTHPCPPGALIILHSDGISNPVGPEPAIPGLSACNPALIAAVLLRDFGRARDDASVLVVRYLGHG